MFIPQRTWVIPEDSFDVQGDLTVAPETYILQRVWVIQEGSFDAQSGITVAPETCLFPNMHGSS